MMWRAAILLLLFPFASLAQTIKVTSGEHDTFSRLVLTMPVAQPWQVGRTDTGYELALEGPTARFDVSGVFDLIPKDRLKGIFVDPTSGNLQMTIGCACHALPFSLNDTTIVIDLRDGPPPDTSSFEQGLDGQIRSALTGTPEPAVRPRFRQSDPALPTFDWLAVTPPAPVAVPFPIPQTADSADNIRESLVAQLADGASRAVITLALPDSNEAPSSAPYLADDIPIRVTGGVGLQIGTRRVEQDMVQPDGKACVPDDMLDLNAWAEPDPAATQYVGLSDGLVGEFDRPQTDAIIAAAKRQIYLGFGAEARSTLTAFGDPALADAMLLNLADLVDGDRAVQGNTFTGMASCDSAAAMWAFLAGGADVSAQLNDAALKRAFSALPAHLRTHLGPRLIESLIAADRADLTLPIRDAMGRGSVADTRAIALATADVMMADDNAADALPELEAVMTDAGAMQAQALPKLVAAQIAAGQSVEAATAEAILAMMAEYKGHPLHQDLSQAYGLALAGSHQFEAAAEYAKTGHPLDPAFWSLLAEHGTDDDLLMLALSPPDTDVPLAVVQQVAARLDELGFPSEAAAWRALAPSDEQGTGANSLQDDATAMVDPTENTTELPRDPSTGVEGAPADDRKARMARWDENWSVVAEQDSTAWGQLALGLEGDNVVSDQTSLASATASLSRSAEARALIEQLIIETSGSPAAP